MVWISAIVASLVWVESGVAAQAADTFLVENTGLVVLDAHGKELERLKPYATCGRRSPDGRWLAAAEQNQKGTSRLVIRSRDKAGDAHVVPLVWGAVGDGIQPVWAADGQSLLIVESRKEHMFRIYDLAQQRYLSEPKVPEGHYVTDWSRDKKRFLTQFRGRIAWVNVTGSIEPEFLSDENESANDARLSPDGKRILYMAARKKDGAQKLSYRLCVLDLESKVQKIIDEAGHTRGHCWSRDGSRIAYTWQPPIDPKTRERETLLMTCDADGADRKTITSRKYTPVNPDSVTIFFSVVDWR